ncbi:MAG: Fur family transcriptional regulator [Patescibacteria group bacterium]
MPADSRAIDPASLLRMAGLRATPGRISLLNILAKEAEPLAVPQIEKRMRGALNHVTLYRALEALEKAGIVSRVNLEHDHAHFELAHGRPHHHHAVCRSCGLVEDIEVPHHASLEKEAMKETRGFASIERYSLEFFGTCRACAARA